MLAADLQREPIDHGTAALDLCTGSGLLAVTAALGGAASVTAVDVSRRAVLSARINARLNGVRVTALRGDLFAPVRGQRFDLIVCNPPYVPGPDPQPPHRGPGRAWEAGPSGRAFIDRICAQAGDHLNPEGVLLLVQNAIAGESQTVEALRRRGLRAVVVFRHRGSFGPRVAEREQWLRGQGLLRADYDEVLIVRAAAPGPAWPPASRRTQRGVRRPAA
jgi:release factor glutamine methyltransferase